MSLGYTGMCNKIMEDDSIVIYSYAGENWNDNGKSQKDDSLLQDGIIVIHKDCLEEPEIHIKIKKLPSGKKKTIEKRITHIPAICDHVNSGKIIIEKECKNSFKRKGYENPNIDYIAYNLLVCIFEKYQTNGVLPEKEFFIK